MVFGWNCGRKICDSEVIIPGRKSAARKQGLCPGLGEAVSAVSLYYYAADIQTTWQGPKTHCYTPDSGLWIAGTMDGWAQDVCGGEKELCLCLCHPANPAHSPALSPELTPPLRDTHTHT